MAWRLWTRAAATRARRASPSSARCSIAQRWPPTTPCASRPGQRNLEIEYTALSWSRPQRISFKYRMAGLDPTWVDAGTRRTAYYPYLPPGSYTFTVIADNGEGVWNTEGASLQVTVLPAFYQTGWFLGVLAIAGVGTARARLETTRRAMAAHAGDATGVRSTADCVAGERAQADRRRAARQPRSASADHHEPRRAGEESRRRSGPGDGTARRDQRSPRSRPSARCAPSPRTCGRSTSIDSASPPPSKRWSRKPPARRAWTSPPTSVRWTALLAPDNQIVVYRIIQESINNILKHSGATRGQRGGLERGRHAADQREGQRPGVRAAGTGAGPIGEWVRARSRRHGRARPDSGWYAHHRLHAGRGNDSRRADSTRAVEHRWHTNHLTSAS